MDRIILKGISAPAHVGTTPQERESLTELTVDVELSHNLAEAGKTDDLTKTIDYAAVTQLVRNIAGQKEYNLIEAIAEHITQSISEKFKPQAVKVKVKKKALPGLSYAAVEITRNQNRS